MAWARENVQRVDNRRFDVDQTPYVKAIFKDDSRDLVVMKSAQTRLSITVLIRFMWRLTQRLSGIYYFPTEGAMGLFAKGRVDPLIDQNPKIKKMVRDTDSIRLKAVCGTNAYFLGMAGDVSKESTPADHEVFDEFDLMLPNDVDVAKQRLEASDYKRIDYIGNPSLPDYGIHALFQDSDQKWWAMKCPHCQTWNTYLDEYNFDPMWIEQGFLACKRCRLALDTGRGEWVAKHPDRKGISGYQVSRLFARNTDYLSIWNEWRKTVNRQNFYNRTLGLPWSDKTTKLTERDIYNLCGSYSMFEHGGKATAGIDLNPAAGHHIVVTRPGKNKLRQLMWLGVVPEIEDVMAVLARYDLRKFAIDAQYDQEGARKICRKFPGKGYMNFYSDSQKDEYNWDDENSKVSVNRTESLDASQRVLREGLIELPRRTEEIETFANHCANIARKTDFDPETGKVKVNWIQLGANKPVHYRHTLNYDCICWYHGQKYEKMSTGIIIPENVREVLNG